MDKEQYLDEGITHSMKGHLEAAVESFQKALELDRGFVAAEHQLGKAYMRMGQTGHAVEILQRVVQCKPYQVGARIDLGYAYLAGGWLEEAKSAFMNGLAIESGSIKALNGLALVYFKMEDWEQVIRHARAVRQINPDNFGGLYFEGIAASRLHLIVETDEALTRADEVLQEYIAMQPYQAEGYVLRGDIQSHRGAPIKALESYSEAARLAELAEGNVYSAFGIVFTGVEIFERLARTLARVKNVEASVEVARSILLVDPNNGTAKELLEFFDGGDRS